MRSSHSLSLLVTFSLIGGLLLGGCPTTESGLEFFGSQNSDAQSNTGNDIRSSDTGLTSPPADNGSLGGGSGSDSDDSGLQLSFPDCSEPSQADTWRTEIIRLVNQARAQAGIGPVVQNDILEAQAAEYACQLIQFDFFDHVNPVDGSTLGERAADFGYSFLVVGENLAAGQTTPQQVFGDWMDSPGHRRNIMDPRFTELGVGVRSGGTYGMYWVQEFGQPAR